DASDVRHAHDRAVGVGAHHDGGELLRRDQPALRAHRVGELLARGRGLRPDRPRRVHGVLLVDRREDLRDRDVQLGEGVGPHPEPERVLAGAEDRHLPDARYSRHRVVQVDVRVVREPLGVVGVLRGVDGEERQRARRALQDGDTLRPHVLRELRLRLRVAHVRQDLIDVGVAGDVEVDAQRARAVARVRRVHVDHPRHTAHLLLDGRRDRLLAGERIGAGIRRGQLDLGGRDVRVERDRQRHHRHDPHQRHEDRDDHRDDRAVDEEAGHRVLPRRYPGVADAGGFSAASGTYGFGWTFAPVRTFWSPSATTRSPGLTPSVITQSPSYRGPTLTPRISTVSSGPTTATWWFPWTSWIARSGTTS